MTINETVLQEIKTKAMEYGPDVFTVIERAIYRHRYTSPLGILGLSVGDWLRIPGCSGDVLLGILDLLEPMKAAHAQGKAAKIS